MLMLMLMLILSLCTASACDVKHTSCIGLCYQLRMISAVWCSSS